MVKAGEVYVKSDVDDVNKMDERPWNLFNPSKEGCGLLTYLQQYIFWDLKASLWGEKIMPEFIHGLNGDTLKQRIEYLLEGQDLSMQSSLSMDGSAFDSNQHISLLKAVDETFI